MYIQPKISMGRVRQAYALTRNEVENVIKALWPDNVFPLELWRKAHEKFWRAFTNCNVEIPAVPELDTAKFFHTHVCSVDIMLFFKKMSEITKVNVLQEGLRYILEETYEEIDTIFPEEREFLFSILLKVEKIDPDVYYEYSDDASYEDKILAIPISSYHFISDIFSSTVLVDTIAVIRHLHSYPLRQEVKGLTQRIVDFVLNSSPLEIPPTQETTAPPVEPAAEEQPQPQDQKPIIRVPASLWEGRPGAAVRDAMKTDYHFSIIAYVLFNWCRISKTQVGHLLSEKEYKEGKSYRNFVDNLLEEAALYTILKA